MKNWLTSVLTAAIICVGTAGIANADVVTFSNIIDGNNSPLLFDVGTTVPVVGDENTLQIGLNNFTANGSSTITTSAVDTLSMTIDAPAGFYITAIDYSEAGSGMTTNGVASASGSIVADGMPTNFLTQIFTPNTSGSWAISPSQTVIDNKFSINVTITNSLFAFNFSPSDVAIINKDAAELKVTIERVPEPGTFAITMIGMAAIFGTRRRR